MDFLTQDASQLPIWAFLLALVPALIFWIMRSKHNARVDRIEAAQQERLASIGSDMARIYGNKRR